MRVRLFYWHFEIDGRWPWLHWLGFDRLLWQAIPPVSRRRDVPAGPPVGAERFTYSVRTEPAPPPPQPPLGRCD